MKIRTFHLHPKLVNSELLFTCKSDPKNPKPSFRPSDVEWAKDPPIVWASHTEAVRFELHPCSGFKVKAFSADGLGNESTWQTMAEGARSPFILTPYDTEHAIELTIVVTAIGPVPTDNPLLGEGPEVHVKKCPVKVVFTPRLGE